MWSIWERNLNMMHLWKLEPESWLWRCVNSFLLFFSYLNFKTDLILLGITTRQTRAKKTDQQQKELFVNMALASPTQCTLALKNRPKQGKENVGCELTAWKYAGSINRWVAATEVDFFHVIVNISHHYSRDLHHHHRHRCNNKDYLLCGMHFDYDYALWLWLYIIILQ